MKIDKITAEETLGIRHQVLWPEKPVDFCRLDDDIEGIHYGGFIGNKLISVASIFIDDNGARLRKFATLQDFQGRGYGTEILNYILDDLRTYDRKNATGFQPVTRRKNATGFQPVVTRFWCDARVSAEGFYNRFGMEKTGDVFLKSGKEYIVMEKKL